MSKAIFWKPAPGTTMREISAAMEQALRKEARESQAPRLVDLERRRIAAERAKRLPINGYTFGEQQENAKEAEPLPEPKPKPSPKPSAPAKLTTKGAADDKRAIKVLNAAYKFGQPKTKRRAAWDLCRKSKTVAAYAKAGGPIKYLARWEAAGAIALT